MTLFLSVNRLTDDFAAPHATQGSSMRPGQNKRMRGRNNRKGPNPLTRTYESNGPDVKIRGTAHHVAEKYLQLARDAHTSSDPVMAESYLQHAEHYFRLIAAAQLAQQQAQPGFVRPQNESQDADEGDDDDDFGGIPDRFASPPERTPPPQFSPPPGQQQPPMAPYNSAPQPYAERQTGDPQRPQQDRGPRQNRPYNDRNGQNRRPYEQRPQRDQQSRDPQFRDAGEQQQPRFENRPPEEPAPSLPAFITGGAPRPAPQPVEPQVAPQDAPVAVAFQPPPEPAADQEGAGFHLRGRRRRKRPQEDGEAQQVPGELPLAE